MGKTKPASGGGGEPPDTDFWGAAARTARPPATARARPAPVPQAVGEDPAAPSLSELCEPLFQWVCRLNRQARHGANHPAPAVRAEVRSLLTNLRAAADAGGPHLAGQFTLVELPLLFFVDFTVATGRLPFAAGWDGLARELHQEMAGDEKFFDLLDETLADRSDAAGERLAIFYTCIGLGFTGLYTGQPEVLRKKMLECATRIRGQMDADPRAKVCPDAYEHVNTADLVETPGRSLLGIGIALVGMTVVLFVTNAVWFRASARAVTEAVDAVAAPAAGSSGAARAGTAGAPAGEPRAQ